MKKVIIDVDTGIDDSLAIMLASASKELDILGITVVSGNVPMDMGYKNTLKVLKEIGRLDIKVYKGASLPLERDYVSALETHGEDGLGETYFPDVNIDEENEGAIEYIGNCLRENENLTIIALGPLTNIALAHKKYPDVFKNLTELVSMGGNFKSFGNCSPVAEYNYWVDPHAAKYVFENLNRPIVMCGLDVTREVVLNDERIDEIKKLNERIGDFVEKITDFYFKFHWEFEGIHGCVINDPLAVYYAIDNSIFKGIETFTTVETEGLCIGMTIVDEKGFWKKKSNSLVLTDVDSESFFKEFIQRLGELGKSNE